MAIDRRDVVAMLRHENEQLKASRERIDARLTRHKQAFRALIRMDDTMQMIRPGFDLDALISELLALALHACDSEHGSMVLLDEDSGELEFVEVIGETRQQLLHHRIAQDTGIVGHVVAHREAMLVNDVHKSSQWSSEVDRVIGFNTNALMCAPLAAQDRVFGALEVVNTVHSEVFDESDLAILRVTARFVSQALREAELVTRDEVEFA